jgi:oligoribonuclease
MDKKTRNTRLKKILWIDLEMTGLDPTADSILEVAAIVTDWNFVELGTYQGIVKGENLTLQERFETNKEFWSANSKFRDELITQNKRGQPLEDIEAELLNFIDQHFEKNKPVLLGGNSIHMDRRFIAAQWPRLDLKLHYRMLDVSAWKVVFEGKYGQKFTKPENHRALNDIRGSIEELKFYLEKIEV